MMNTADTKELLKAYEDAKRTLRRPDGIFHAAACIAAAWPDASVHPMLAMAHSYALDIDEEHPGPYFADNDEAWRECARLFEAYIRGDWIDTSALLSVMYAEYDGETNMQHSFTLTATRRNGQTEIACAISELHTVAQGIAGSLNQSQSDQWYLRNLLHMLPTQLGAYRLVSSGLAVD